MTPLERQLISFLRELIDIEGPQPGHVMWYRKVKAVLDRVDGEEK